MENRGSPVRQSPTVPVSGQGPGPALDLFKLYHVVNSYSEPDPKDRDWTNVAVLMNISKKKSNILMRIYAQYLLDYELDQKLNNNNVYHHPHQQVLDRKVLLPTPVPPSPPITASKSSRLPYFKPSTEKMKRKSKMKPSHTSLSPTSSRSSRSIFDCVPMSFSGQKFGFMPQDSSEPVTDSAEPSYGFTGEPFAYDAGEKMKRKAKSKSQSLSSPISSRSSSLTDRVKISKSKLKKMKFMSKMYPEPVNDSAEPCRGFIDEQHYGFDAAVGGKFNDMDHYSLFASDYDNGDDYDAARQLLDMDRSFLTCLIRCEKSR